MDIQVEAYLVERVSQKGKTYKAVEIYITDKIKKLVFNGRRNGIVKTC